MDNVRIKSPCRKICSIEPETGFCLGCGRSREEIKKWRKSEQKWRDEVVENLPARLQLLAEIRKKRRNENKSRRRQIINRK